MSDALDPVPSGADSLRELVRDQEKKKRRTRLVLFVIVPLVAIVGAVAWVVLGRRAAEREIAAAWNEASACLVGAPLAEGERASLRFRAVQLAAVHLDGDKPDELRWPDRCADAAAGLFEALRKHGREAEGGEEGLGRRTEQLALELRKAEAMGDLSAAVDGVFDAAKAMGLSASAATLATPTPEPDRAPNLDTIGEGARLSPLQYTLDRVTGTPMVDIDVHVLIHDPRLDESALLCTFTPDGKDRCKKLGGAMKGKTALRLGGTTAPGASPLVLAGNEGESGVYRSDSGEKITAMRVHGAYVGKDGYVAIAGRSEDEEGHFELVQQRAPGAEVEKRTLEPKDFERATHIHRKQILWDRLMVQTVDDAAPDQAPHVHSLALPAAKDDNPAPLMPLNWVNAVILGCRTADTLVARVGIEQGYLSFFDDGSWSTPLAVDHFPRAMSCDMGEAVFTAIDGSQERCTAAGCQSTNGSGASFDPFEPREGGVADLNGKVLAVTLTEKRGGVRYRWDDGKALDKKGQDRLLFDDLVADGAVTKDSKVLGMVLLGRGRFAVVLLTTPKGVYALRFGPDGKPVPAKIEQVAK